MSAIAKGVILLPIAVVVLIAAHFILRNVTERTSPKLDVLSIILSSFGFGGLLCPASHGEAVWRLSDYLEDKIKEQGKDPYPYSILKTNIWYRYKN
jgi:hypothetical protein